MRRAASFLVLFTLSLAATSLEAATNVSGVISTNTTWTAAGSPYILTGTVSVGGDNGPTLTIQAGVVVRANAVAGIAVTNKGALVVNGTAGQPVLFTANASGTPPQGYWTGIVFGLLPGGPQSRISHATLEYAGYAPLSRGGITVNVNPAAPAPQFDHVTLRNNLSGLTLLQGSASLSNCTITSNGGPGIHATATAAALTLTNNTITNNNGYAVTLPLAVTLSSGGGNSASGNGAGRDGIEYQSGVIAANRTWPATGIPYLVSDLIDVRDATSPVLTIAAGATVRFNAGAELSCNRSGKGAIRATGTAAAPVVFTSNTASTPGAWLGLRFGSAASGPQSSLTHATIEHAGSSSRGGILIESSPTLDNVTIRNNATAGITLVSGSPSVTNSTIASNGGAGIHATGGTSLTLTGNTFTGNAGYAVTLPVSVSVTSAGGNTATGNGTGRDAIEYRAGTITANTLWPAPGIPYAVSGIVAVMHASAPVLRIAAGTTVKFNSGGELSCNESAQGALRAIGTAAAPILFTSNGSPTPGAWNGLWFGRKANPPQSTIKFATIEYGGMSNGRGGATVYAISPQFEQVTFRNNLSSGIAVRENGSPRVSSSRFEGNPLGIHTTTGSTAHAVLNYWSSAAGPCLTTPCAGGQQYAGPTGVTYEPWLKTAPTPSLFVTSANHKNVTFNPSIATSTSLDYTTSLSATAVMTVRDASDTVLRTLTGTGTSGTFVWNGRNDAGALQPDGTYYYEIAATATSQPPAAVVRGFTIINGAHGLVISNLGWSNVYFSPNGDSVRDTTTLTGSVNYDDVAWTITLMYTLDDVECPQCRSYAVRTVSGTGPVISFVWDGRDEQDHVLDGNYYADVEVTVGTAVAHGSPGTILDTMHPTAFIGSPSSGDTLSNIYTNGAPVTILGSAVDTNIETWKIAIAAVAAPNAWVTISSGTTSQKGSMGTWQTLPAPHNEPYLMRLTVEDKAKNSSNQTITVNVANFKVAPQTIHELNALANQTITYTSTVPFPVRQSVYIRNVDGVVVRTLVSSVRNAGTYTDTFDGRNDLGALLPDGPYFHYTTVTAGNYTYTWDRSNVMLPESVQYNDELNLQPYDPFNNKPLIFTTPFTRPGRVSVATLTNSSGSIQGDCLEPTDTFFCPAAEVWRESGNYDFSWWGIDHTGSYRSIVNLGIVSLTRNFPENAAILFGSKPKVKEVRVTPPIFGPEFGSQVISFQLATFAEKNEPLPRAAIHVDVTNLETKSTLRVVDIPAQAPGSVAFTWDGRAADGRYLAPGRYSVVVTATDPRGNVVTNGILTTIQY